MQSTISICCIFIISLAGSQHSLWRRKQYKQYILEGYLWVVVVLGGSSRMTLNTKGPVAAGRRPLPLVPANRELHESSNSK